MFYVLLYGTELCNAIGTSTVERAEGMEDSEGGQGGRRIRHVGCNGNTVAAIAEWHCRSSNIRPR
jgi:hypothetical protein